MKKIISKIQRDFSKIFPCTNFPSLDTEGNVTYYFGGNAHYGLNGLNKTAADHSWLLIDTDCSFSGQTLESAWGKGCDGQYLLDYTNELSYKHLTEAERYAILPLNVTIDKDKNRGEGEGTVKEALFWPLSIEQFRKYFFVTRKISLNSGLGIWSRSYVRDAIVKTAADESGLDEIKRYMHSAWISLEEGHAYDYVQCVNGVAPAFLMNLGKAVMVKEAASGMEFQNMCTYEIPRKSMKFLILDEKMTVPDIKLTSKFYMSMEFSCKGKVTNATGNFISYILYKDDKIVLTGDARPCNSYEQRLDIILPDLEPGEYSLAVFRQKKGSIGQTDYASKPAFYVFSVINADDETLMREGMEWPSI